jgi:DNA-directed RNA polymerase specialized sigma subunit
MVTMISINQLAQETGDTSANEANRIREREALIRRTWRSIAHNLNRTPTAKEIAERTGYPEHYIRFVCECSGHNLLEVQPAE